MKTTFTAFGSDTLKITIITTEILENSKRAFILFESTNMKFRMRSVTYFYHIYQLKFLL